MNLKLQQFMKEGVHKQSNAGLRPPSAALSPSAKRPATPKVDPEASARKATISALSATSALAQSDLELIKTIAKDAAYDFGGLSIV